MKKNTRQALIEALLICTLTISLFVGALKIGLTLLKNELKDRIEVDSRLKQKSGFVLINFLMQLPILLLLLQAVYAAYVFNVMTNNSLEQCMHAGLDLLTGKPGEQQIREENFGIMKFKTLREENEISQTRKFYHLRNSLAGSGDLQTLKLIAEYKCGAEVLCFKEKCRYKISADKL